MTSTIAITPTGREVVLDGATIEALRAGLRGELLTTDAPDYDSARAVWNAMIDKRPALIVRCRGAADVISTVNFARGHGLLVSVRGGGHNVAAIIPAWFGPPDQAAQQLEPLRKFGVPLADLIGQITYGQLQTTFDAAVPSGLRRYWKSGYLPDLPDDLIDVMLRHAATKTSPYSLILFFHIHGKAARIPADATAFGARTTQWDFDIIPQWQTAVEDEQHIEWARSFWKEVEPFTKGVYSNHLDGDDGGPRLRAAYGRNYDRLASIKRKYDPDNFLRMNNNIAPSVERA